MANPKWRRRIRVAFLIVLIVTVGMIVVAWRFWMGRHHAQWQSLQVVLQIEREGEVGQRAQQLGWSLAILGRDHEVRNLDFHPHIDVHPLQVDLEKLRLNIVPWRDGVRKIAAEQRIVMIMEDHAVSKHREMIGAALPILRDAGFTHYAAEAIGESGSSLTSRGYPSVQTGYYTSDPQFGNTLRRALDLEFKVLGYDYRPFTHEWREEFAASELAKPINDASQTRLVIHAGFAHVLKHETEWGQRWLAAILWEKTGVEPFTIWQWSSMHNGEEYRVVAEALERLGDFDEPVLLMPPPNTDCGLPNVPRVDAILVHPPDRSRAPDQRTVLFPSEMRCVKGRWLTDEWPVVIAAMKRNEPTTAIPLDQIMMREKEQDFVLWIPEATEFEIVVFDQNGARPSSAVDHAGRVEVKVGE